MKKGLSVVTHLIETHPSNGNLKESLLASIRLIDCYLYTQSEAWGWEIIFYWNNGKVNTF